MPIIGAVQTGDGEANAADTENGVAKDEKSTEEAAAQEQQPGADGKAAGSDPMELPPHGTEVRLLGLNFPTSCPQNRSNK